jgi:hypothetical protein
MYCYFLDIARKHQAEGQPVPKFVQTAIDEFQRHPLRTLMERLDEHNLSLDQRRIVSYSICDRATINLTCRITVERTANGLLCLMRWDEHLNTVKEDDFIPEVLKLLAQ